MNKSIFVTIIGAIIFIGWCTLQQSRIQKENTPSYIVKGTISYHNFEKDRGDGIETPEGKNHAAIILQLDTKDTFSPDSDGKIILGCISGNDNKLYRELLQLTWSSNEYNRTKKYAKPIQLSENLDQKYIEATITKPITAYKFNSELIDGWRIWSCLGYSDITNITIVNK